MSLPLRVRLTMWNVALLTAILALVGIFLVLRLRVDLIAATDRSLAVRAEQLAATYRGGQIGSLAADPSSTAGELNEASPTQILSPSGAVLASSGEAIARSPMIEASQIAEVLGGEPVLQTVRVRIGEEDQRFRVLAVPASGGQLAVILVADSLDHFDAAISRLIALLLFAVPAALVLAGAGASWLARKALFPMARMTQEAGEIGLDRIHERVEVPDTSDELQRLAETLNDMLDRIETGVEDRRRFVADASHELRTPLAIMRSELDEALGSSWLSAEARDLLESQVEETDRMGRIVGNLLTLAWIDEGRFELLRSPVDLQGVAEAVVAEFRLLAAGKGIRISADGGGEVVATVDRERLHQALANLVDNAVKYTSSGGRVEVAAWVREAEAGFWVRDSGDGIPLSALPRIFDRFFRVDASRSRNAGGSGLGLAICREIAHAHDGRVWVESEVGKGSSFFIGVPTAPVGALARRRSANHELI